MARGSITPTSRKCLFLFLLIAFTLEESYSLRTSPPKSKSSSQRGNVRLHSSSAKERRLSFLNHQLSLLGGQVSPDPKAPITSKIYSRHVDRTTGTDEISIVDVTPNSDLVVGREIPRASKIVLECQADFPVNWIYKGDGSPGLQTNTTSPSGKKGKYSAIAMIGGDSDDNSSMEGRDTGEYICRSTQNPQEHSLSYYIYVPGRSFFIRRGGVVKLSANDHTLRIPCSVTNPEAKVTILKSNNDYLQCVQNETMSFNRKSGFTLNLVEDDEANDPVGQYVCMAGINDSYQLAEYSVVRSYENDGGIFYDDNYGTASENEDPLGRDNANNEDVCTPNPCGANSICEAITNPRNGDPFTCRCQDGFRGQPPRCRSSSLCDPNPCGPNAVCKEDPRRNYPKCSCLNNYIGRPPNCRPECNLHDDCHPSLNCVNHTCQNPCLRACSLDAVCSVQDHQAKCSCPMGSAGDPSYGGRCHKIRLPPLQFFPFFGLRPRPSRPLRLPPPPMKLHEEPQQIFPGDSVDFSEEIYNSNEVRNPCEPWPCGPYSQCTPVGEFAHCKCNQGYVGLPPNCRPECRRDQDCSSTHQCTDNNCKDPCKNRGRVRCGSNAQCRGRNHQAECYCPSGFRGDPLVRCYPSDSSSEMSGESGSQEGGSSMGMWGSPPRPPPSTTTEASSGSSEEEQRPRPTKNPNSRPGATSRPKPSNPMNNDGGGSSCSSSNFCGKNAVCVQRNNTVTCRCKQGYTGPGSDPYTECTPSRNPCHKCGPNSVCRVSGNGAPTCECQPGKLGSPPNCRDNLCKYNSDCPSDQQCHRRSCIDPCTKAKCGPYATCKGINHYPVCACPHDPDKDPFDEGGCPPPPNSSKRRNPGFFPPTRFFI